MASISDTIISGGAKSFTDALDRLGIAYQLYDNPGISSSKDRDWIGSAVRGNQVPVWDGQQFKLMQGDKTLYQGTGIDGLRQAAQMSGDLGKGWRIISSSPTGVDEFDPALFETGAAGIDYGGQRKSDFGEFLPYALLAALPFGATAALGGLGAGALGSAGGGAAGGAATGAATGAGLGAASAIPAFEGITVLGGTAGGLGAAGAAGLGAAGLGGLAAATGGSGAGAGSAGALPGDIVVQGGLPTGIDFGGLSGMTALGGAGAGLGSAGAGATPEEIVVQGDPSGGLNVLSPIDLAGLGAAATVPVTTGAGAVKEPTPTKGTVDKIVDYLQLGSLGVGLLGNLFGGGGGSGSNGTIPNGLGGGLGSVFTDKLPVANLPGTTTGTTGTRAMPDQDWTRYAMRPEQSFFNYVPEGYKPPAAGQTDAQWDKDLAVGAR